MTEILAPWTFRGRLCAGAVVLACLAAASVACVARPEQTVGSAQCTVPPDDDGLWATAIQEGTQCPWMNPPDYTYQPVTPIDGWTDWAPDLTGRSEITMLVMGDLGCESCETPAPEPGEGCRTDTGGTNVMVAAAASRVCNSPDYDCDLAVTTGDNFYPPAGLSCASVTSATSPRWKTTWRDNFGRFVESDPDFRFWSSLGNHDYIEGNQIQAQVDYTAHPDNVGHLWMMPDRSYRIPRLPEWMNVWVVDSVAITEREKWGETDAAGQVERVAAEMRAAAESNWQIVVTHHPALSIGQSGIGSLSGREGYRCQFVIETTAMRAASGTWADAGMNVMLSGHEHDHQLQAGNGFLQVVEGAASKQKPCEFTTFDDRLFASDVLGFSILEFTETDVTVLFFDYHGDLMPGGRLTYSRDQVAALTQQLR